MDIENVAVQIFNRKLPKVPRFIFNVFNYINAPAFKFCIGQVNVFRENPMDMRFD